VAEPVSARTVVLPATPEAPRIARAVVAQVLGAGDPDVADRAALLVSEVTTNAVIHAHSDQPLRLIAGCSNGQLHVEVHDGDPAPPVRRWNGTLAEGGRGMELLELLATRHGTRLLGDGKAVWFELTVAGDGTIQVA
jgi:anti-sigma regulatory factor (Ser/Thr protein kinase)